MSSRSQDANAANVDTIRRVLSGNLGDHAAYLAAVDAIDSLAAELQAWKLMSRRWSARAREAESRLEKGRDLMEEAFPVRTTDDRSAAIPPELEEAVWRALGEASFSYVDGGSTYVERLWDALRRENLEVRFVER